MNVATISIKNQITIPKALLSALNILPQEKVVLEKEDNTLVIKPLKGSIVKAVAGSLADKIPKSKKGLSFSKIMAETKRIAAKEIAEKL